MNFEKLQKKISSAISVPTEIALSFVLTAFIGGILLTLPISLKEGSEAGFFENLFNSISAVCVTGLSMRTVASSYTTFGKLIMIFLMQIGGLGLMTLIAYIYTSFGRPLDMKSVAGIADSINSSSLTDTRNLLKRIVRYTAIIEGIGALAFSTYFVPHYGWKEGIFNSIFMSVSAFCNAGFDPVKNNSLIDFQTVPVINWTIMILITVGGIGFNVWFDVLKNFKKMIFGRETWKKKFQRLSVHTQLTLVMSLTVFLFATIFFLVVEWNNPETIGKLSLGNKVMTSMFQSVTMRTGGFATVDYTKAHPINLFMYSGIMLIGGGSGGTAGGIKLGTFFLILLMISQYFKGDGDVVFSKHSIPSIIVRQAVLVFTLYLVLMIASSGLMLLLNPHTNYLYLLFETSSALATTGVSANLTPTLSHASALIDMFLMLVGRIGPATILLIFSSRQTRRASLKYTRADVLVG